MVWADLKGKGLGRFQFGPLSSGTILRTDGGSGGREGECLLEPWMALSG